MDLSGHVAIVTGAAVRIGRAIALRLAAHGADVAVHYGTSAREAEQTVDEIRSLGRRAEAVPADLADPESGGSLVTRTVDLLGPPSLLINSAAIFETGSLETTDRSNWDRHLAINLSAPFYLSQAWLRYRDPGLPGHIINLVDWRGETHPTGHLAYTVSKAGLIALTRMLAQELAPDVRVNGIAPGPVLPPPGEPDAYLDPVSQGIPLKRRGYPEDIVKAVTYLLDADFITGEILHVTGGQEYAAAGPPPTN